MSIPRTDAERLYDVLDRLTYQVWEQKPPEHRWSPIGAAVDILHEMERYKTERCIIADTVARPAA